MGRASDWWKCSKQEMTMIEGMGVALGAGAAVGRRVRLDGQALDKIDAQPRTATDTVTPVGDAITRLANAETRVAVLLADLVKRLEPVLVSANPGDDPAPASPAPPCALVGAIEVQTRGLEGSAEILSRTLNRLAL